MELFTVIFAALIGALAPRHAAARAILMVLTAFTIITVDARDILLGKCTPGSCDTKRHTDVYGDDAGKTTKQIKDLECHNFQSYVNLPVWLGDADCKYPTRVDPHECTSAPPPSYTFHLVCPVPTSEAVESGIDA